MSKHARIRLVKLVRVVLLTVLCSPLPAGAQGIISTIAGNGSAGFSGDGGPATQAALRTAQRVVVDSAGNVYFSDTANYRIRRITPEGIIDTVAGNGAPGYSGDGGPANEAALNQPNGVALDMAGNLYIADSTNNRIRRMTPEGIIRTVAGNGVRGYSGDGGAATEAALNYPMGVAVDAVGNLYIADTENNRIRKVTLDGIIRTVAGNGEQGAIGDGGPATDAQLFLPADVAIDRNGNMYLAESRAYTYGSYVDGDHSIRKVTADGIITTVAGGRKPSDGLCFPQAVAIDAIGNVYITDSGFHRIRRLDLSGALTTVAGSSADLEGGFGGDGGPAIDALLDLGTKDYLKTCGGAAVDSAGNLYIADCENSRIRKVTSASTPLVPAGAVVNAASFASGSSLAPGSLISVFGYFLASEPSPAFASTDVTVGDLAASPLYISTGQINAQVPYGAPLGETTIAVRTAAGAGSVPVALVPASPGIFTLGGSMGNQGAVLAQTGEVAAPIGSLPNHVARPAARGEFLSIYATGLGDVTNRPASGTPAPSELPWSETVLTPTIWIGGVAIQPSFSGLAPGWVGLNQVNVKLPAELPTGDAIPLRIEIGGVESNTVTIAVQ